MCILTAIKFVEAYRLKESSDMLFQLCRGASKTVFGQYPENNACNSFTNLIDVRSQCKVYLGMNEIPLRVREQLRKIHLTFENVYVCSYYFTSTRDFALKDYIHFKQTLNNFLQFISMLYDVQK